MKDRGPRRFVLEACLGISHIHSASKAYAAEPSFGLYTAMQVVEDINGAGALWGLLQMPFNDTGPGDIPIQMSKQYYAMLQACAVMPSHSFHELL